MTELSKHTTTEVVQALPMPQPGTSSSSTGPVVVTAAVQPTQLRRPWRTTLRTAFQTALAVIPMLGLVVPQIVKIILDESGDAMPDHLRLILLGISAGIVAIAAIVARIMALPIVEQLLRRFAPGLAAAPKK